MNKNSTESNRTQGPLRIGDLARLTGKTVRALHLYEEMGLLKPVRRTSGGFRLYQADAVERVRWIDLLNSTGISLHEMQRIVRAWWSSDLGPEAMVELRTLFQRKLDETREAIQRHEQLERELAQGLAYLETCRVCGTREPVSGCISCQQDHGMEMEPVLVAGLMSGPERKPRRARAGFVDIEDLDRGPDERKPRAS